jgi:antitoxin (DNA-binding transcriptional repressor) of toxin-antitoxin stability system
VAVTVADGTGVAVAAGGIPVARIRSWAREHGYAVSDRGRLGAEVIAAFHAAVSPDK